MSNNKSYIESNKKLWNKRVVIHINSVFYDVAAFKAGKSSLNEIELNALENINAIKNQ
ncbi:MAG TPA: hypothetical protein VIL78_14775 [Hanamia sp.]